MFYDSVTKQIRQSYECSADSAGFGLDCTNVERFSDDIQKCIGKYDTNRLRIRRSIYESSTNHVRVKGNSWQFLTIREIFSLQLGIKCHLPLLGHYFQNKCLSESCCCIGSTFGVPIPTVESTRRLRRNPDPDFLLFGW